MSYKILIPQLLLKNNTMGNYGQEVTEGQLTDKPETLIAGGYIAEVVDAPADDEPTAEQLAEQAIVDAKGTVDAAADTLKSAQDALSAATDDTKASAEEAVNNATVDLTSKQAALDALVKPVKKK